jgi:hypothetical protein
MFVPYGLLEIVAVNPVRSPQSASSFCKVTTLEVTPMPFGGMFARTAPTATQPFSWNGQFAL